MKNRSLKYSEVTYSKEPVLQTGDVILDEFISNDNGFVVGSAIFLTGTSGAGKTTFAYTLQKVFEKYITSLYSREMSGGAVKQQMSRYEMSHDNAYISDFESCPTITDYIAELDILKPKVVIVDSLQVIAKEDYKDVSEAEAAYEIIQTMRAWTEKNDAVLIIVGHVNKDGSFEGKNTIVHMFDAHLEMIFDKKKNTRTISWTKNRKGETGILFYDFGKEKINFFTPDQWATREDGKRLKDFVYQSVVGYVSTYKGHKNYKEFVKEFKAESNKVVLTSENSSDLEVVCEIAKIAEKLEKKYING